MKYLKNVPEDRAFVLGDTRIRSLKELVKELYNMSDGAYNHYASESHNYFADWIQHVIKHKTLAGKLRKASGRKEAIKVLEKKIEQLKKPKKKPEKEKKEEKPEKVEAEEPLDSFVVSDPKAKKKTEIKDEEPEEKEKPIESYSEKDMLRNIAKDEREIKDFLWKHFAWDMAKEFMYGLAIGILVGFVLSKIFMGG